VGAVSGVAEVGTAVDVEDVDRMGATAEVVASEASRRDAGLASGESLEHPAVDVASSDAGTSTRSLIRSRPRGHAEVGDVGAGRSVATRPGEVHAGVVT
jgi:hypothetical protein